MVKGISIVAIVAVLTYGAAKWWSQHHIVQAGFWFDQVTYDLLHLSAAGFGGPLTAEERQAIEQIAWSELRAAFAGLRIEFSDDREAHYQVRVLQEFPESRDTGSAGESRVLRPLGGAGAVNLLMLGSQAISHAPPGADRQAIVNAIGRGIGRAAVHEFAHQLVPHIALHDSQDPTSYEFGYSSRPAQYYGEMRWDNAWAALVEKLGPVDAARAATRHRDPE